MTGWFSIFLVICQDVENQMQQDSETARDQIASLEDQLQAEKRRRDDADIEISKQKQVLNWSKYNGSGNFVLTENVTLSNHYELSWLKR